MKKIIFYSYAGQQVVTLIALCLTKPKNVEIDWYLQTPVGEFAEFIDAIISVRQFGFNIDPLQGDLKEKVFANFKGKIPINLNYSITNRKIKSKGINIYPVVGKWAKFALLSNPDAILLPTIRLGQNRPVMTLSKLAKATPLFLHEYGTTMKKISGFDLYKERHSLLKATFTHGKLYHKQAEKIKTEKILTGGCKSDFFHKPYFFQPPTKKPFLVYCTTVSHIAIYDNRLSEPQKWVKILQKSCNQIGFELVIKLHPHDLFLYQNSSWSNLIYFNAYSADLFRQSSGIISDPSSVLAEALLANKPIFIPQLDLPSWNYIDLMLSGCYILGKDPLKNARLMENALRNDPLSKRRKELIKLWWHKPDGNASKRIWQELLKRI